MSILNSIAFLSAVITLALVQHMNPRDKVLDSFNSFSIACFATAFAISVKQSFTYPIDHFSWIEFLMGCLAVNAAIFSGVKVKRYIKQRR